MQLIIKNRSSASGYTAWKLSVYAADDAMGNMDEWTAETCTGRGFRCAKKQTLGGED